MGYIELNVLNNDRPEAPALGIDLGTTNSLAAVFKDGAPSVIRHDGNNAKVPSVIHFPLNGKPHVGKSARDQAVVDPLNTIFSIKRFMGRGLKDLKEELESLPYQASETEAGVVQLEIHGQRYTPEQLSALILMRVHDLACKAQGGEESTRAVITVPAYFDENQRQATRGAARLAGIEVLRIINEPTAASLAYGLDQRDSGTVCVFDLGGGTFDVSILSIEDGVFRVLATAGDTHLGGDDFDRRLVQWLRDNAGDELDEETLRDPAFQQAARLAAEHCKHDLSDRPVAEFHLVIPDKNMHFRRTIERAEFDALVAPLIERTIDACRSALNDAGLEANAIDEVVMVGGSTRIPAVQARVEEFFGRKPHTELNPDEVVALGAAIQAHILTGGSREILLMDVTPLSLGLETMGGAISKIISRNSTIPCQATEGFTTYADNQTGIDFNIVQGERELAKDCRSLGTFKLSGIPPMPAGMAKVAVRFHIDADGILTVSAKEESTGQTARIEIQPMNGLTDEQVESMLQASLDNAREDFDQRRVADLKVEIGTMKHAIDKNFEVARDRLDKESILDLEEALAAAAEANNSEELEDVQAARDALEQASLPLAAVLMDSVAKKALTGKSLSDV